MPDIHTAMLVMPHTQLIILERDLLMLNQKLSQKLIHTTTELMDMDMLDIPMPTTHTLLTTLERDRPMLNQKLIQKLILTTREDMDMLDTPTLTIHTQLTILERDLLMLRLSLKLIHTILPTMDMVVDITVIHMGLTTLESKSKTEKRSKD